MVMEESCGNVFKDLGFPDEEAELLKEESTWRIIEAIGRSRRDVDEGRVLTEDEADREIGW